MRRQCTLLCNRTVRWCRFHACGAHTSCYVPRFEWLGDRLNSIPNASATSAQQVGSGQQYDVLRVPHRQNRCVIFNSNLFHRTATLSFKPGYRTRRINLTLLFGTRQPVLTKAEKVARRVERDRLLRAQGKL